MESIFGSGRALQAAEAELKRMLTERGVSFGDGLLPTYAFAFVAEKERIERWGKQAELVVAAADAQARHSMEDAMTCDTVAFTEDLLQLVYADPGYERCCVITRPDGILVGDDVKFVELNCDSPAMMMFCDIVSDCLMKLEALSNLRDVIAPKSSADMLLETLLDCYRESGGKGTPTIAITDWAGQKTRFEHLRLSEHFTARGYPTIVCDPRSFKSVDGYLHTEDGRKVDLVYRRALASEILARRHEIQPLLQAYLDRKICMVNPLCSYIAGAKSMMSQFVEDELPPEYKGAANLIPRTFIIDNEETRAIVLEERDRWALKKSESHGGQSVLLPGIASLESVQAAIESSKHEVWIAQEYIDLPKMMLPAVDGDEVAWQELFFNWNPFVFGGKYAGGLVRTSSSPLINITLGGGLLPTFTK